MLRHYWIWGTVIAMGSLLLAGCGSPPANGHPTGKFAASDPGTVNYVPSDPGSESAAAAHAHYGAGVIHEMNDERDAALEEYRQAAIKDPSNEALVLEVTRRLLQNKQPEKALEVLTRATELPGASGSIFARLGTVYSLLGKNEQAVAACRLAIQKSPNSLSGYQDLFVILLQNKKNQEALKMLDDAGRKPDLDVDFLIGLAELYSSYALQVPAQKDVAHARALALLNRVAKLKPDSPSVRLQLADSLDSLGESDRAADIYLDLLKKLPDVPLVRERVHAKLTEIYLRNKDHKRALEQLQAIIRDDPTNPQAYFYLGSLAYDEKKLPEAVEYFTKAVQLNEKFEPAYYELALSQIGLNQTSDALATLSKARQKFSANFVMEYLTATAFSRQKAFNEALQHYTAAEVIARATEPKRLNEEFYFQIGAAAERKGDIEQAEKYFQKSLEIAPKFVESMNYLGYMWAEHDMKLDQARALIEQAIKAEPKNAAFLDSLAWVYYKLKQPKTALTYMLRAVENSEQPDATIFDHLGDIYAAIGQTEKAREAWTKSVSLEANEEIQKKLEPGEKKHSGSTE
jgi:tetratricopeptide (TPR) repeat protein